MHTAASFFAACLRIRKLQSILSAFICSGGAGRFRRLDNRRGFDDGRRFDSRRRFNGRRRLDSRRWLNGGCGVGSWRGINGGRGFDDGRRFDGWRRLNDGCRFDSRHGANGLRLIASREMNPQGKPCICVKPPRADRLCRAGASVQCKKEHRRAQNRPEHEMLFHKLLTFSARMIRSRTEPQRKPDNIVPYPRKKPIKLSK